MIGLTGGRGMGKTHVADTLVRDFGFTKVHAFAPGKAMCREYFVYLGMDHETAWRSVYGDLKDTYNRLIPGDGMPRTFMEDVGKFMGTGLGPQFTLGVELARVKRIDPEAKVIIESVVYEAPYFSLLGGFVVDVIRLQNAGGIVGKHTDEAVKMIKKDYQLDNSSDDSTVLHMHLAMMLDSFGVL